MTVKMTIVQEISRPVSDDKTRNLSKWLDDECEQCTAQRERSGFKEKAGEGELGTSGSSEEMPWCGKHEDRAAVYIDY